MKKIGFVISGLAIGGNENSVAQLSKALSSNYQIYIIVFDGKNVAFDYDGELIDLHEPARKGILNKLLVSYRRVRKIKQIIKDKDIDVLFTVTASINVVSYYCFNNVLKIVSCRDCGDLEKNIQRYAYMLKSADYMVFNSAYMKAYYLERYPQDTKKCYTVNNIVDTKRINGIACQDVEESFTNFVEHHDTIVAVGRLVKEKGFNHLIRAFCKIRAGHPKAGLVIIGDGILRDKIAEMVKHCQYQSDICLLGAQNNPYKYMQRCKLFALSSESEGFPNVLLEGMACGLPIVATDCKSGPQEILMEDFDTIDTTTGYRLADYGVLTERFEQSDNYMTYDADAAESAFAEAVLLLLNNKVEYKKYAELSYKRAEYYNFNRTAAMIQRILD